MSNRTWLLVVLVLTFPAQAHEVRPAFLKLTETSAGVWEVLWKQPIVQNRALPIAPVLPEVCPLAQVGNPEHTGDALVHRWTTECTMSEGAVHIQGLSRTLTDVLVQIEPMGEDSASHLLRPDGPTLDLADPTPPVLAYLQLGVEHLVFGIDHVLFVIGLLLFIPNRWQLVKTITAFTVAHSITLALSVLELVKVPQGPVEAIIALSILFLARELMLPVERRSALTRANPWVMAFTFGLLHGFGFAGALADIGLPRDQLGWSLFLFNLGIELGQLLIIAIAAALGWLWRRLIPIAPPMRVFTFAMGSVAGMWTIERVLAL